MKPTQTQAWQKLLAHKASGVPRVRREDVARLDTFSVTLDGLRLITAFQNISEETVGLLLDLAREQGVESARAQMFSGAKINTTEKRAVLHTALRQQSDTPVCIDGENVIPEIRATQKRISSFVDAVRSGQWTGATGKRIRHIVNIGIGGSDLGPRLVAEALNGYGDRLQAHFVANVDAYELQNLLKTLDPAETLFVIVSKTFTTQETLLNAKLARQWAVAALGEPCVAKHFVAVSVNHAAVESFGISAENMFPMWDWVGGRYSVWSAVGLSVALLIGNAHFSAFLKGAAAMDAHFCAAPLAKNMPVLFALMGIWNRNFLGSSSLAILPYAERLRDLPRFLQQLEMESNGKSVTKDGQTLDYTTAPVIFGECGSVGQHSFHQCLHQGTDPVPADFIGVASDDQGQPTPHRALLANMAAQIGALAFGQTKAVTPQDIYPGSRPSNVLMLDRLDPYTLGQLLALYEHKTFVQGVIWDINSFDQPGVELGKRMAKELESAPASNDLIGRLYTDCQCVTSTVLPDSAVA